MSLDTQTVSGVVAKVRTFGYLSDGYEVTHVVKREGNVLLTIDDVPLGRVKSTFEICQKVKNELPGAGITLSSSGTFTEGELGESGYSTTYSAANDTRINAAIQVSCNPESIDTLHAILETLFKGGQQDAENTIPRDV